MNLTKDESICLVLGLAYKHEINSKTKLNKLLGRLNLNFIPLDFEFTLHKNGSFAVELGDIEGNELFDLSHYDYKGTQCTKYILKEKGMKLFDLVISKKLPQILSDDDINEIIERFYALSKLSAREIADNEHKKLLVDVDDRFILKQTAHDLSVELFDLYGEAKKVDKNSFAGIDLRALIEYSYFLVRYLSEKKFKKLDDESYDFEADMLDYYFLYNIAEIIPFMNEQLNSGHRDIRKINKFYQFLVHSAEGIYPFSLENPDLKDLCV